MPQPSHRRSPRSREVLPIDAHLPELVAAFGEAGTLVVVADPGAGKTTRLPPALLEASWLGGREIWVTEPRRLAARLSARRVASELGVRLGGGVGYQVRFDDCTSAKTRLRYVTEGVLLRRLEVDPQLENVGIVIMDELHERSLHADVGLALLRQLRQHGRPDLRVGAMSATMDAETVATYLGAPIHTVPGRTYEVAVEYLAQPDERPLDVQVAIAVRKLLAGGLDGDVLIFLPGAREIRRCQDALADTAARSDVAIELLHGDLPQDAQDRALAKGRRRKIILSTNIAETSLTIEGIVAVVDGGLARFAKHSPWTGLPSLVTGKISRASAAQRAGRAGRTAPGVCLRLYTRHDHDGRPEHDAPEIGRAELAETVLSLLARGLDPMAFPFLERPPSKALDAARDLLRWLGAIEPAVDGADQISDDGRRMLQLPLHPRLAKLVLTAQARGVGPRGCLMAALISERDIRAPRTFAGRGGQDDVVGSSDLLARLESFETAEAVDFDRRSIRDHDLDVGAVHAVRKARDQLCRAAACRREPDACLDDEEEALLTTALAAFPDRVGRRRRANGADIVFAAGGAGRLHPSSVVREAELLVALDVDEGKGGNVIRLASSIEAEWLLELFPDAVADRQETRFDEDRERVQQSLALAFGAIALDESPQHDPRGDEVSRVLVEAVIRRGLGSICDMNALERLRRRIAFAAVHDERIALLDAAAEEQALAELSAGANSLAELRTRDLVATLLRRLPADQQKALDRLAPETVDIAGRKRVPVNYETDRSPWIASRMQDFFGTREGPRLAGGAAAVALHLLAPNQRAVQITDDLAGFWQRHYPTLRKQLMRRYPKHFWPEDPLEAEARRLSRR